MTGAMQLVSAAKKRRSIALLETIDPFVKNCLNTMSDIRFNKKAIDNPFFTLEQKVPGQTWKIAYFVLCGDQGLAGAYNNNVVKACEDHVQAKILENSRKGITTDYKLYVFGKVVRERLLHMGYNVDTDLVYLVYTQLESALNMKVEVIRLAPVDFKSIDNVRAFYGTGDAPEKSEITYYPDVNEVFGFLMDSYLNAMVYGTMTQAYACEQTARFAAMDNATNSAEDMMKTLQLKFNRARQAKITNELTEIINGANQVNNL